MWKKRESASVLFSAIQPSGFLTIANYLGVLKSWIIVQNSYDCIYCIADLHSMTVYNKKVKNDSNLQSKILDTIAVYLACGVNPKKSIIFVQSDVPEHAQLNWILNCYTPVGELFRMIQFKEKSKYQNISVNSGLLTYPILMAADILLYSSKKVLVGKDQKQHLELSRTIARRFNNLIGQEIFTIPESIIQKFGSTIKSLLDPTKKMSKSDKNKNSTIFLLDDSSVIHKKIMKSVTDSEKPAKIFYDKQKKPGISNLLEILAVTEDTSVLELEKNFYNKTYKDLKEKLSTSIVKMLCPIQDKFFLYRKDEVKLKNILKEGAQKAKKRAKIIIKKVMNSINVS